MNALKDAIARAAAQPVVEPAPTTPTVQLVPTPTPTPESDLELRDDAMPMPKSLAELAVLVSVKRNMYNPYITDKTASEKYGAGNVSKHLFKNNTCRVKQTISRYSAVYNYVRDHTYPWSTGINMYQ